MWRERLGEWCCVGWIEMVDNWLLKGCMKMKRVVQYVRIALMASNGTCLQI